MQVSFSSADLSIVNQCSAFMGKLDAVLRDSEILGGLSRLAKDKSPAAIRERKNAHAFSWLVSVPPGWPHSVAAGFLFTQTELMHRVIAVDTPVIAYVGAGLEHSPAFENKKSAFVERYYDSLLAALPADGWQKIYLRSIPYVISFRPLGDFIGCEQGGKECVAYLTGLLQEMGKALRKL